jgi:hypothetical protein
MGCSNHHEQELWVTASSIHLDKMTKVTKAISAAKKVLSSETKVVVASAAATTIKPKWNTMSHLYLKRFSDNDPTLTAGAKRNRAENPHIVVAEVDPSGRATCKLCGDVITKGSVRVRFMLECHKGYRMPCTLHSDCFDRHPERAKLQDLKEIHLTSKLSKEQINDIIDRFEKSKSTIKPEEADEVKS